MLSCLVKPGDDCMNTHLDAGNDVADLLTVHGGMWSHDDSCAACHVLAHLQCDRLYCRTCRIALAVHHEEVLYLAICF